jgi:hypothetical protein
LAQRIAASSGSTNRLTRTPAAFKAPMMPARVSAGVSARPSRFAGDLSGLHRHQRALIGPDLEDQLQEAGPRIAFDVELNAALERCELVRDFVDVPDRDVPLVARGCTVIPGAPASMHVRTASITDGILSRRASCAPLQPYSH